MENANKIDFMMSDKEFQKLLDELPKLLQELKKRDRENRKSLVS